MAQLFGKVFFQFSHLLAAFAISLEPTTSYLLKWNKSISTCKDLGMSIYCSFSCYGHKFMTIESMIETSVLAHCDKTRRNNVRRKDVFASWLQRFGPWSLDLLIQGEEWDMTSPLQECVPEGGLLIADKEGLGQDLAPKYIPRNPLPAARSHLLQFPEPLKLETATQN